MKIAIVGYGKMGMEIEKIALERGHEITAKINKDNLTDLELIGTENTDVAIEFTSPQSAFNNIVNLLDKGVRTISGSTGWLDHMDIVKQKIKNEKGTFFYASNYSLGVNITFQLNKILSKMMNGKGYKVSLEEIHHTQKIDSPSGTAITLANDIINYSGDIHKWVEGEGEMEGILPIKSKRINEVPGTHVVSYESPEDNIEIKHVAHSRRGFALGAVMVAEWIQNKSGFLTMDDYFDFSL